MVGMERSILTPIAEQDFHLTGHTAMLSFIAVFGLTKALTNYAAGRFADRIGRRRLLLCGWALAVPVPFLLMWAPGWTWIIAANALLGVSQGLTWSMTVIMKIDLVGPERRGLAMGLNECAGYVAVAAAAYATGWIASRTGLRPEPFYLGVAVVIVGVLLSLFVHETWGHSALESASGLADTNTTVAQAATPRQQLERRHGMGPLSIAVRGHGHEPVRDRHAGGHVPGHVGHRSVGDGRAVRSRWPQMAHRVGHVDTGCRNCTCHACEYVRRIRRGYRVSWCRNGDGLSHFHGGHRRRGTSGLARHVARRLSALARRRIRCGGIRGRGRRRRVRFGDCDAVGRSAHVLFRDRRSGTHVRDAAARDARPSGVKKNVCQGSLMLRLSRHAGRQFTAAKAAKELNAYRKDRLGPMTRHLRDSFRHVRAQLVVIVAVAVSRL
jgi:hypothetical protein